MKPLETDDSINTLFRTTDEIAARLGTPIVAPRDSEKRVFIIAPGDAMGEERPAELCVFRAPHVDSQRPEASLETLKGKVYLGKLKDEEALVVMLRRVRPGADLYAMPRKRDELWNDRRAFKLPADTAAYASDTGEYNLVAPLTWFKENGIALTPDMVLDIRQMNPDDSDISGQFVSPINGGLYPADKPKLDLARVDGLQGARICETLEPTIPPAVLEVYPREMAHHVKGGHIHIQGPLKPGSKVLVENVTTGAIGLEHTVGPDGRIAASVRGDKDDAFLVHLLPAAGRFRAAAPSLSTAEHYNGLAWYGDRLQERIFTGMAGKNEKMTLIDNPWLTAEGPPELRLDRFALSARSAGDGIDRIHVRQGITPGSIVSIKDSSADPPLTKKLVADPKGSLGVDVPGLAVDQELEIEIVSPFRTSTDERTIVRARVVELEPGKLGLEPIEGFGDYARVVNEPDSPVRPASNVDRLRSTEPVKSPLPFEVKGLGSTEDLTFDVALSRPIVSEDGGGGAYALKTRLDRSSLTITITLTGSYSGGYLKRSDDGGGFATKEETAKALVPPDQEGHYYAINFRNTLNASWKVRIEDDSGRLLATALAQPDTQGITGFVARAFTDTVIRPINQVPPAQRTWTVKTFWKVSDFSPAL
jgi:hypothetical protein